MGFKDRGVEVATTSTLNQAASGALSLRNGILFFNNPNVHSSANTLVANAGGTIAQVNPELVDPFNHAAPNFRPQPGSPALSLAPATPPNDGFFEIAQFLGALDVDPENDWTLGWTSFAQPDPRPAPDTAVGSRIRRK